MFVIRTRSGIHAFGIPAGRNHVQGVIALIPAVNSWFWFFR